MTIAPDIRRVERHEKLAKEDERDKDAERGLEGEEGLLIDPITKDRIS